MSTADFGSLTSRFRPKRSCSLRRIVVIGAASLLPLSTSLGAQQYGPVDEAQAPAVSIAPASIPRALADAVNQSLQDSPVVLGRRAALAALDADLDGAKWLRYPTLTAEALAATRGSFVADRDGLALNVALEQPIWTGGNIGSQIDVAKFSRDVGHNALREARTSIQLGVIRSYYEALLAFERAKVLKAGLKSHRDLVVSIERRVAQEVSPVADLTLALSRLTQLEVELTSAEEAGANAMLRLFELVGQEVSEPVLPSDRIFADLPVEFVAVQEMMSCSPRMDRLRSEMDVAEAQVRTTKTSLYPQVLLQLSQNEITGARAAIVLRAQTGPGLARYSAIDSAEARVDEALAEIGQADREARTLIGSEYVALRANKQREEAGILASKAASDLQASYQRQFVAGRRSWLDVLNAAREVTSAKISESDARVSAAASATRILALSCRWRPDGV